MILKEARKKLSRLVQAVRKDIATHKITFYTKVTRKASQNAHLEVDELRHQKTTSVGNRLKKNHLAKRFIRRTYSYGLFPYSLEH